MDSTGSPQVIVLENLQDEIDQAERDIDYHKNNIQLINEMYEYASPEQKAQYDKAIVFAGKQIQSIRLAQVLMLEEQALKQIVISN